jgi:hypothetical protein
MLNYSPLGESIVLWQIGKHDLLVTLVGHEDVAGRLDHVTTQGAKGSNLGAVSKKLEAERSTLGAGVTDSSGTLGMLVLDEIFLALDDFQVFEDAKLHSSSSLLTAEAAVAPAGQSGITSDLAFKVSAHAFPGVSGHDYKGLSFLGVKAIICKDMRTSKS